MRTLPLFFENVCPTLSKFFKNGLFVCCLYQNHKNRCRCYTKFVLSNQICVLPPPGCYASFSYVLFFHKLSSYYLYDLTCSLYRTIGFTIYASFSIIYVTANNLFNVLVVLERSTLTPMLFRLCHMVCIQVVFGLLCGFFAFLRYSSRAILAGV